jgi:hypothetical protein
VSFELDIELFMRMLAHGNNAMRFDVHGDELKVVKQIEKKQIEGPRGGAKKVMLDYLVKHKDKTIPVADGKMCIAQGYADGTASSQLHVLLGKAW